MLRRPLLKAINKGLSRTLKVSSATATTYCLTDTVNGKTWSVRGARPEVHQRHFDDGQLVHDEQLHVAAPRARRGAPRHQAPISRPFRRVPIKPDVTTTISPPIQIAAVVGIIAAAALGIGLFLLGRSADPATLAPPPPHVAQHARVKPAHTKTTHEARPRTARFRTPASGFPRAVDRAFRTHRVVVLAVYMPGASVDAIVRKEARAGAVATGAGYVQVSALNNALATEVLAKTGVLPEPAVVVIRRPGVVVATLGVTDRQTVAQAVFQAKHPRR
jgi:hypothetical protein